MFKSYTINHAGGSLTSNTKDLSPPRWAYRGLVYREEASTRNIHIFTRITEPLLLPETCLIDLALGSDFLLILFCTHPAKQQREHFIKDMLKENKHYETKS